MVKYRIGREHQDTTAGPNLSLASFPQIVIERMRNISVRVQPKFRKTTGPVNLSGRVLNVCNVQLCDVFARLFNLSVSSNVIPALCGICPVPKNANPVERNDVRPIVLMYYEML